LTNEDHAMTTAANAVDTLPNPKGDGTVDASEAAGLTLDTSSAALPANALLWIVDDDPSIRFVLERAVSRHAIATRSFENPRDVLSAMAKGDAPHALISDIRMPGGSGVELLAKVKALHPNMPVIVMTAYSDLDSAVSAFQGGAFEYLPKPFDVVRAVDLIRRALSESVREAGQGEGSVQVPELLGKAPAMQEVFRAIGRLSQSQVTVLITGESGTGKELVAHALHRHSPRSTGPFVAINTAAIPKDLLESELFGHERGAFTGAQALRKGRFEQAEGGTLFLDEIGDMPLELQTRLLRVLSDGQYYRVGGHQPLKSSVRIIAATHQHLEQRVRDGVFREDLFHRLNVIRLRLPPLRERREDIPALARFFMGQSARVLGVEAKRLSDSTQAQLAQLPFPGNVRQLENLCHWLTVMAPAAVIQPKDLPPLDEPVLTDGASQAAGAGFAAAVPSFHALDTAANPSGAGAVAAVPNDLTTWVQALGHDARSRLIAKEPGVWEALTHAFEAQLIRTALDVTHGRRIEAAQRLGIGRNTITRKIQELGLDD
jgi:two-component system, NtrC family, nitrogen regulation response regulator GlnG